MRPIFSSEGLHCNYCLSVVTPYEKLSQFYLECEKGSQECLPIFCKGCREEGNNRKNECLLWLDDLRNPFEGTWIKEFAPEFLGSSHIVWVLSYEEFIEWIRENGLPKKICFDHEVKKLAKSGYDCAKWLVDYCIDHDTQIPYWNVQSANPVGKENINGLLINAKKHLAKNP
jgi:hypothetical protein